MLCFFQIRVRAIARIRPIRPHAPVLPEPQSDAEHKDAPQLRPFVRAPPNSERPSFHLSSYGVIT